MDAVYKGAFSHFDFYNIVLKFWHGFIVSMCVLGVYSVQNKCVNGRS